MIHNKYGKFDEEDVQKCEDIEQLEIYLEDVDKSIIYADLKKSGIKDKIAQLEIEIRKCEKAKHWQQLLRAQITTRMKFLENEEPLPSKIFDRFEEQ